jgi:hypothetical protein
MDQRFGYDVFERKVRMGPERVINVPSVRFEMDSEMVEAIVFPRDGIRQTPISPIHGKPMREAGLAEAANQSFRT